METEGVIKIWICKILGPTLGLLVIIDGVHAANGNVRQVGLTGGGRVAVFLICLVLSTYGYRTRRRTPLSKEEKAKKKFADFKSRKKFESRIKAAEIELERKRNERNKPLTKGDLEDLKEELRETRRRNKWTI